LSAGIASINEDDLSKVKDSTDGIVKKDGDMFWVDDDSFDVDFIRDYFDVGR